MESPELSAVARGGIRSLTFRGLTAMSDFLVVVVTARGFGAEGRGIYTLTSTALASVVVLLAGPQMPMRAEIGRKRSALGALQASCVVLSGVTLAIALVVVTITLSIWPDAKVPVYAALATPFVLLAGLQVSLYQAQGDVRRMGYVALATSAVPLMALTTVAITAPGEIELAMLVWACAQVIVPFTTTQVQRRQARFVWKGLRPLLTRLFVRGLPVAISNGVALVGYRMPLVIVAALLSVADAGRYSLAIVVGEVLFMVSRALLTGAYAPLISSDLDESVRVTMRTLRHIVAALIPMGAMLVLGTWLLAGIVFGPEFEDVWVLIALLLPGFLAVALDEVLWNFFVVRLERSRELVVAATGAAVLNIAGAAGMVLLIGLPGAAITTSIAYCGSTLYLVAQFSKHGGPRRLRAYVPTVTEFADYRRLLAIVRPDRLLARFRASD